jgi:hypothetical protein
MVSRSWLLERSHRAEIAVLTLISALVITASASAAAGDHFTCRASALRVQGAGALSTEPEVANSAGDPCTSAHSAAASVDLTPLLTAVAGPASTSGSSSAASASSQVANVSLPTLGITADAASSHTGYACSSGQPLATSSSSVVNLSIGGGAPITTSGHVSLTVGGIAHVELNRTLTGPGSITQRAVDITVLGGPYSGAEVVLGEAAAGLSGDPCDTGTTGLKPPGVGGGPPSTTPSTATFGFTFQPGTTLQCSLDDKPYAPCTKSVTFTNLSIGWHVLSVRELKNGVTGPVYTFRWRVTGKSGSACEHATGRISGRTLGRVSLGMTRVQTRRAYRLSSSWTSPHQDFFCLKPVGIRAEYAWGSMLSGLRATARRALLGRVVLALTANRHYALGGIRHGATLAAARRSLGAGNLFHIGINWWYFVRRGPWTAVLKVHHGVVAEVGVADGRLTASRKAQLAFIRRSR